MAMGFVALTAASVLVLAILAYVSPDFKNTNDLIGFLQTTTNNPLKMNILVLIIAIVAGYALLALIAGAAGVLKEWKFANIAFAINVMIVSLALIALAIVLIVYIYVYGTPMNKSVDTMCSAAGPAIKSNSTAIPLGLVGDVCKALKQFVSFCSDPTQAVKDLCKSSDPPPKENISLQFNKGLIMARALGGSALSCGLIFLLMSCCLGCFVYELLVPFSSALDKLDCCKCLDKYDQAREKAGQAAGAATGGGHA